MNTQDVYNRMRGNYPGSFYGLQLEEVFKILAVIEAREELLAEENERIHDEAYAAAMEDKMYGSD